MCIAVLVRTGLVREPSRKGILGSENVFSFDSCILGKPCRISNKSKIWA